MSNVPWRLFIPQDTVSCALGADRLAEQVATLAPELRIELEIVRNGSRGLFWLEPLVELERDMGQGTERIAFGSVEPEQAAELLSAINDDPSKFPHYLGDIEKHDYLSNQQRLTFKRAGLGDPCCLDTYQALDGFSGLKQALALESQAIVDAVKTSGLRGRGGAAFPTGIKWQTVLDTEGEQKYIACNADEGDSGTFADRLLMEADPYQLIEGMTIAGLAVGATRGHIYLRSEYPKALQIVNKAIEFATDAGFLGENICGSGKTFELDIRVGAGAYICGEETSMLESLEGKRGMVRPKPPLPAVQGLFGCPTVVNNVLTLAAVSTILSEGAEFYRDFGMGRSRGTVALQLAGNVKHGGLVELAFGIKLEQLVNIFGGGTFSGNPIRAIQAGGPLGAYIPETQWDTAVDYESFSETGAMLGHGGIVVFDDTVDMAAQARFAMEFCSVESCGKCTPCRIGSVRGVEVIDKICADEDRDKNLLLLKDLCDTMEQGSLCAMGGLTPFPVRSALQYYPEDFNKKAPAKAVSYEVGK